MQLQELKNVLERCRNELKRYQHLLQEREQELAKIQSLKKNVETDLIQWHRLQEVYPQKAAAIKKRVDDQTGLIAQHKKKLQGIDAELDHLGEEKEAAVIEIKYALLREIQEYFPGSSAEYIAIERGLKEATRQSDQLRQQQQLLLPLQEILQQGAQIKLKARLFDFLWGRHPKAMLARAIHQAVLRAEKIEPQIQDERLKPFLENFLKETKSPSNSPLYQGRFGELATEFSTLTSDLDQEIIQSNQEIASHEQALETWIEKHCQSG